VLAAARRSALVVPPFPVESLETLRRKPALAKLAADIGVSMPATVAEAPVSELLRATPALPCAIKPVAQDGPVRSTTIVRSPAQIEELGRRLGPASRVLVQPLVPGALSSLGIVMDRDGQVTAAFQQVARRTWPAAAGSSAMGVGVPLDGEVVERAASVLRAAGFYGLAEVEFLLDGDEITLIDVNPRFYGCLALALASGVNLAAAWRAAVLGLPPPAQPAPYRAGVSYRWLEADVISALRGSAAPLFEPVPRPRVGAMWAADDPVASVLMAGAVVTDRFRARVARRRSPVLRPG
jgi:predicted ATP-grasp superfamily ATP-dependent carboligase